MNNDRQGLWDFALKLYGAPGVADACLILQDESGVDVPVLLFSAWLSRNGVELDEAEIARVDGVVKEWRDEVVKPLRAVRRRLKTGLLPAPTKETESLRNGVKGIELSSEKIEIALLETEGEALMAASGSRMGAMGNLALVVGHYRGKELDAKAAEALAIVRTSLVQL